MLEISLQSGNCQVQICAHHPNGVLDVESDDTLRYALSVCDGMVESYPYHESFDHGFGCWSRVDADGRNWIPVDSIMAAWGYDGYGAVHSHSGPSAAGSCSWTYDDGPMAPDNWLVSPAFSIPNDANHYYASWYAGSLSEDEFDSYSVYVSTSSNISSFTTPLLRHMAPKGYESKYIDLAPYAGQTIYVAFRHHQSGNNYMLLIDDFEISTSMSVPSASSFAYSVYPNPTTGVLVVEADQFKRAEIYDALGRKLLSSTQSKLNLSSSVPGIYSLRIFTESGTSISRIVVQ